MNRPHYTRKKEQKEYAIDNIQSPFIKYSMTVTCCIIVCSVAFIFLLFNTDTLIDIDYNTVKNNTQDMTTRVSSVVDTLAQIDSSTDPDIPGLSTFPVGDWYQDIPNNMRSAGSKVEDWPLQSGKTIPLYDSIPWDADDNTYRFDIVKAAQDTISYIDTKAGKPSNLDPSSAIVYEYSDGHSYGYKYKLKTDNIDAITIAPPPCAFDREYCDNFKSDDWMTTEAQKPLGGLVGYHKDSPIPGHGSVAWDSPRKYCIELTDNSGKKFYMPACAVDAKGHTFPGGVMQTHLKLNSPMSTADNPFTVQIGDNKRYETMTWTELVDSLDTMTNVDGYSSNTLRAFWKVNLEINGINGEDALEFNRRFNVTAYYAW